MFREGQKVWLRSLLWKVSSVKDVGTHYILTLEGAEDANRGVIITALHSDDVETATVADLNRVYLGNIIQPLSHWMIFMNAINLSLHQPLDIFTTLLNSKIRIEKYQFVPLLKAMKLIPPRILIADDVGLGKTIEAGILLQELASRNMANRVLIVVPASLQDQWKDEMEEKFGMNFEIFDTDNLRNIYKDLLTGENPWEKYNFIITSIDYVKRPDIKRQLMDVYWDVVIIDEAHYLSYVSKKTDRARFGEFISQRTHALILLTATPHSGRDESFFSLIKLLNPHIHSNMLRDKNMLQRYFIRRLKTEVFPNYTTPTIETIGVTVEDGYESEVYSAVKRYAENVWNAAKEEKNSAVAFAMVILKKRLLSSYYALKKSLESRRQTLVEYLSNPQYLKEEGEFTVDSEKKKRYLEGVSLTERQKENFEHSVLQATNARTKEELEEEIKTVNSILEKLDFVDLENERYLKEGDSKARRLLELLNELGVSTGRNKAIIFTEYRDTQEFLVKFLENNGFQDRIVIMNGLLNRSSRLKAEKEFLQDDKWIMVATDAASEGLNFQEKCHIIINYELPWNPNRLLQRIGRVDRYGQKEEVIVKNLYLENTYEGDILNLLIKKLTQIIESIGSATDVLGMFDAEAIVDRMMEEREDNIKSLDEYFEEWERINLSRISDLYKFMKTPPDEHMGTVEEKMEVSLRHLTFLENFIKEAIKKLGGDYEEINENVIKFIVPSPLRLKEREVIGTFDRDYALEHNDVEFITLKHPLVQAIIKYYRTQLYDPRSTNRVSYMIIPGEEDSVTFFFYAKYADGNNRLASEKIIPVRVTLEGKIIEWDDGLLRKENVRQNLPPEFLDVVKSRWDFLFEIAEGESKKRAEDMISGISQEIEEKLKFNINLVENYYNIEIGKIKREIEEKRKALEVQIDLFGAMVEERNYSREQIKKEIMKLEARLEKLESEKSENLRRLENMKNVKLAEHGILSALIIRGEGQ